MKNMTDEEIRQVLIERKKATRRKEAIGNILGWFCLFGGCYLIAILGYVAGIN